MYSFARTMAESVPYSWVSGKQQHPMLWYVCVIRHIAVITAQGKI